MTRLAIAMLLLMPICFHLCGCASSDGSSGAGLANVVDFAFPSTLYQGTGGDFAPYEIVEQGRDGEFLRAVIRNREKAPIRVYVENIWYKFTGDKNHQPTPEEEIVRDRTDMITIPPGEAINVKIPVDPDVMGDVVYRGEVYAE